MPAVSGDEIVVAQQTRALSGEVCVPGDKSISHRAAIIGSMCEGPVEVVNYAPGLDCLSTLNCLRSLGVNVIQESPSTVVIEGGGPSCFREPETVLDAGNSGTTIRLLTGVLAASQGIYTVITGDESLRKRPMARIVNPLRAMGASIWGRQDGKYAPLAVLGKKLKGTRHELAVASAQVKSCLLLAGLLADGSTTVVEPELSRDHTERMLTYFGARVNRDGNAVTVEGGRKLYPRVIKVPGDISSAAFLMTAAAMIPGSRVRIVGVGLNPTRAGIIEVLSMMGAKVSVENVREESAEPVGDVTVEYALLKGITVSGSLIPRIIDEIPVLVVAATCADGDTVIRGASELRVKESDRIHTLYVELSKLGAKIEELPDGFVVHGPCKLKGASCSGGMDHRIAMALAVAGLVAKGETRIAGAAAVNISFPGFVELLNSLC